MFCFFFVFLCGRFFFFFFFFQTIIPFLSEFKISFGTLQLARFFSSKKNTIIEMSTNASNETDERIQAPQPTLPLSDNQEDVVTELQSQVQKTFISDSPETGTNSQAPSPIGSPSPEQMLPNLLRTISSGQRSVSISDLHPVPTTALSYVETTTSNSAGETLISSRASSVSQRPLDSPPPSSPAHQHKTLATSEERRRSSAASNNQSPIPTIMARHTSDVATLLSEVLDGDDDAHSFQSGTNVNQRPSFNTAFGVPEGDDVVSYSSSSAMSFYDTGSGHHNDEEEDIDDEDLEKREMEAFLNKKKQYFILSSAGKPIYSMNGSDELISGYMGIFQAIVSYFDVTPGPESNSTNSDGSDDMESRRNKEQLKSVLAGNTLFVFSVEDPLILIAVDKLGQSEYQLRAQLDVLYAQILSTLTKSQLSKVFRGRNNFDLRSLLGGTEVFLRALTREMSFGSPGILLGALECLRLRKSIRNKINNVLIERRTKSLLYGLIVADSRLVSVIRPRRHSLHPPDLHLVFSMLFNTASFSKGGEHWVPICLPKFNSTGFLYAYIYFFLPEVALVLISPDKNAFFEMREGKEEILRDLEHQDLITPIQQSLHKGRFKTVDIPVPLVRHFLYKSKPNVQFLMPSFETHYYDPHERHKLMVLYHQLHGAVHTRQQGTLKVYHTTRRNLTALAWVTPTFEIYCVTAGSTTKEVISQSVKSIVSWIKLYEERLFVIGGAVF